ncbi:hypothetical protein J6590_030889 [Homalodisca vitripennis]|nr:hypothetical protein J6590_030889 [Homalodisca vitripennis]
MIAPELQTTVFANLDNLVIKISLSAVGDWVTTNRVVSVAGEDVILIKELNEAIKDLVYPFPRPPLSKEEEKDAKTDVHLPYLKIVTGEGEEMENTAMMLLEGNSFIDGHTSLCLSLQLLRIGRLRMKRIAAH